MNMYIVNTYSIVRRRKIYILYCFIKSILCTSETFDTTINLIT